ncbi:MAG: hypothetical protein HUU22_00790 [Phycisphaerae bacterium]|nr:hypothetical protein [Phycisphaerae bacterium]NUQ44551.1 hypothetical protein [Phycisphaerae bacterium]
MRDAIGAVGPEAIGLIRGAFDKDADAIGHVEGEVGDVRFTSGIDAARDGPGVGFLDARDTQRARGVFRRGRRRERGRNTETGRWRQGLSWNARRI